MQHSLHIYIGEDLTPIAEAIDNHLTQHCDCEGRQFSHVASWVFEGEKSIVRQIDTRESKTIISNRTEGVAYFENKHPHIVVAEGTGEVSSNLYVCVYFYFVKYRTVSAPMPLQTLTSSTYTTLLTRPENVVTAKAA